MQPQPSSTPTSDDTSDAVLLLRTREGDPQAYAGLYRRHVNAARVLARQLARDGSEADELVAESFMRVLATIQRGSGPEEALRPYLLTTLRRAHIDRRTAESKVAPTDDLSALDPGEPFVDVAASDLERSIVARAYASLPERWQLVLWHTEIEGQTPAAVAPLLGISPNATAALAVRARAGLRDAYLSAHIARSTEPDCREACTNLGGYVRGTLSRRERVAIDAHLDTCPRCSAAVLELMDTAASMRGVIAPLVLGGAAMAYREGVLGLGAHAIPSAATLAGGSASGTGATGTASGGATSAGAGGSGASGAASGAAMAGAAAAATGGLVAAELVGASSAAGAAGVAGAAGAAGAGSGGVTIAALTLPTWQLATAGAVAALAVFGAAIGLTLTNQPGPGHDLLVGRPGHAVIGAQTTPTTPATGANGGAGGGATTPATAPTTPPPAGTGGTGGTGSNGSTTGGSGTDASVRILAADPGQVQLMSVGDLVHGHSGTLRVSTNNPNGTTVNQTVQVRLPAGVHVTGQHSAEVSFAATDAALYSRTASPMVAGVSAPSTGRCVGSGDVSLCNLGSVPAYGRATLDLPVSVAGGSTGKAWKLRVTSTAGGQSASVSHRGRVQVQRSGLPSLWAGHGQYVVTAGGDALMTCQDAKGDGDGSPTPSCADAQARKLSGDLLDSDAWTMVPVNDGGKGWQSSSTAQVAIPRGTVIAAYLSWSASGFTSLDRLAPTARVAGPGVGATTVAARSFVSASVSGSGHGYVATADVTSLVRRGHGGSWTVGNIALPDGDAQSSVYGGWALTVITQSATAPVRDVSVLAGPWAVTQGHDWTGSAPGLANEPAQVTLVGWDGDAGQTGDQLLVHGRPVTPAGADHSSRNVASSFSLGAPRPLTFGVDVRQLTVPTPTTRLSARAQDLRVTTDSDRWILGMLVVSAGGAPGL